MKHIFILLACFGCFSMANAQKIKYKDLFVLLNAEKYKDAGPYLKAFLQAEPGHANANYQMGKMLQLEANGADVLHESELINVKADSSIMYLEKAKGLITAKDIKKHSKDYYAAFKRRDIRSGKFEVKLSDVQLDIDQRIDQLKSRKTKVKALADLLKKGEQEYTDCQEVFKSFQSINIDQTALYLSTNEDDLAQLDNLVNDFNACSTTIRDYKETLNTFGKQGPKQVITFEDITDFKIQGTEELDFFADTIRIWNYGKWASELSDAVKKQIIPLRKRMVDYDERLTELLSAIMKDSLDMRSQVFKLAIENVARDIRTFDQHSSIAEIYSYKIAEINYRSSVFNFIKEILPSGDVGLQLTVLNDLQKQLSGLEQLSGTLSSFDFDNEYHKYSFFIDTRYQSKEGYQRSILEIGAQIGSDKKRLSQWDEMVKKRDLVTIWNNDTIPLVVGEQSSAMDGIYSTIAIDSVNERKRIFYGFRETDNDSTAFFLGTSPSSRLTDTVYFTPIRILKEEMGIKDLSYISADMEEGKQLWIVGANGDKGYDAQVMMTSPQLGFAWTTVVEMNGQPVSVTYDDNTKTSHVNLGNETEELVINNFGGLVTPQDGPLDPSQQEKENKNDSTDTNDGNNR